MSADDIIAVIAAGGCGSRMRADRPKALMRVCGRTLLEHTLESVTLSTTSTLLIYNNQRAWDRQIGEIVGRFPGARLVADAGVQSTIELAVHAAQRTNRLRLCFLYGHAPRPVEHLRRLCAGPEEVIAATRVCRSSKAHPIVAAHAFLEPPYVLPVGLLRGNEDDSWASLFERLDRSVIEIPATGPAEANWPSEMRLYRRYVRSRIRGQHRLLRANAPRQSSAWVRLR